MRTQFSCEPSKESFDPNRITYEEILREKEMKKKQNEKNIENQKLKSPEKAEMYRMIAINPA